MGQTSISAGTPTNASTNETSVPLLDLARENGPLAGPIANAIARVMHSGRFVLGPECQSLEQQIASRCGTLHAVGCASGSDALLLALMAAGVAKDDEVIVPSFTFFATASAVTRLGARPVFADIDPITFNMSVDHASSLVTDKTRAIIPVHLFGQCAAMKSIAELANRHHLTVIEDCAQSIDAKYNGVSSGAMSSAGCFSFYPTKNFGGCGDGGMITTSDGAFAERLRVLRAHGMKPRYLHHEIGINSRLDTIQAALLLVKFAHLSDWTARRVANAQRYAQLFSAAELTERVELPQVAEACTPVWNQYTIRVRNGQRDALREHLTNDRIGSEIYYPLPLHLQPCFAELGYQKGRLPETERAAEEVLSLPIFPHLTAREQQLVVNSIRSFFATV